MMASQYSISDLAGEFGVTTRAIRFYEEKGLLRPSRNGQRRIYDGADRARLKLILRGKRIGLTLDESREIIEMYEPGQDNEEQLSLLLGKVTERRTLLQAQLADIHNMLEALDDVQNRVEQALQDIQQGARS